MKRNRWITYAAGVLLLFLLGAFAFDKTQSDKVAKGVTIGGIDVSGLSSESAKARLEDELQETVQRPIVVSYEGKTRRLKPAKSKVHIDIDGMVAEALDESNSGFFVANAVRSAVGQRRDITVPIEITYSDRAVRRFVRSVGRSYDRAPVDASIKYSATGIGEVDDKPGLAVRQTRLTQQIHKRLQDPTVSRRIKLPVRTTKAKVTKDQLADKYSTIVVVDRKGFKLRLYKNLKLSKKYG
ncbi:MAG: peptidoglycan binding domain-containing protein, partial [Solirubrobacterales bacterium]